MKLFYILALLLIILSSCSKKSETLQTGACDTTYIIEYSQESSFANIIKTDSIYKKSREKFTIDPKALNVTNWTGIKNDLVRPEVDIYYARIVGRCNDNEFFKSETKKWKNVGKGNRGIVTTKGEIERYYGQFIDITTFDEKRNGYAIVDSTGKEIFNSYPDIYENPGK